MKISVIIPTYNRILFLKRSIDSVLAQTLQPYEIIIVDDGSTDGTSAMIKKNYPNLKLICQENKGVSAARNIGVKASSGDCRLGANPPSSPTEVFNPFDFKIPFKV